MRIEEKVSCHPEGDKVQKIRTLFCAESASKRPNEYNPLIETDFNDLLSEIVQKAFNAGVIYQMNKI
jgi:hypothetical protein